MILSHIMIYLAQPALIIYNIITAKINSDIVNNDLKNNITGSIKHGWWGLAYISLVIIMWWLTDKNYWLSIALLVQRKLIFDIFYNVYQKRNIFFTDKNSKSIIDRIYNWLFQYNAKLYQSVNCVILLIFQFFIF